MAYRIESTIQYNETNLTVYYKDTSTGNNPIWTTTLSDCKSFSRKADATTMSKTLQEETSIVKQ